MATAEQTASIFLAPVSYVEYDYTKGGIHRAQRIYDNLVEAEKLERELLDDPDTKFVVKRVVVEQVLK